MNKQEICERVAAHLDKGRPTAGLPLTLDAKIFKDGTIDSFAKLELTIFIEDKFGVQVDEEQVTNFGSISGVAAYVLSVRAEGA